MLCPELLRHLQSQDWGAFKQEFDPREAQIEDKDLPKMVKAFSETFFFPLSEVQVEKNDKIRVDIESFGGHSDKCALVVRSLLACDASLDVALLQEPIGSSCISLTQRILSSAGLETSGHGESTFEKQLLHGFQHISPSDLESIQLAWWVAKRLRDKPDRVVLDIRYGNGWKLSNRAEAANFGQRLVELGLHFGMIPIAVLNSMDEPLGQCGGIDLECWECLTTMGGKGPADLNEAVVDLASTLSEASRGELEQWLEMGLPLKKYEEALESRGGNSDVLNLFTERRENGASAEVISVNQGFLMEINTERIHQVFDSHREQVRAQQGAIFSLGFDRMIKTGRKINVGDPVLRVHTHDQSMAEGIAEELQSAFKIG